MGEVPLFLESHFGKIQTNRLSVGSMKNKLSLKSCRNLDIVIPYDIRNKKFDINEQERIIKTVTEFNKMAERNINNYRELVKEIRNICPKKLKIKLPKESSTKNIFIYGVGEDTKDRLDVLFNNPYREELLTELREHPNNLLLDISKIEHSKEIIPSSYYKLVELDDISEELGEVVNVKEVPNLESNKILLCNGQILISKLHPYKGKIFLVDERLDGSVGSSELIPLKIISES